MDVAPQVSLGNFFTEVSAELLQRVTILVGGAGSREGSISRVSRHSVRAMVGRAGFPTLPRIAAFA